MTNWTSALLPMLGIVIGALLQFWLSRTAEKGKHVDGMRAAAYTDYLRAVAASAHLTCDQDLVNARRSLADAKTRILVYGDIETITALARFEKSGPTLTSETSVAAFVAVIAAMRSKNARVSIQDIKVLLIGTT